MFNFIAGARILTTTGGKSPRYRWPGDDPCYRFFGCLLHDMLQRRDKAELQNSNRIPSNTFHQISITIGTAVMSYNPRMSIVPNTQQRNQGKKKEEDSDAFMRLVSKHCQISQSLNLY